MWAWAASGAGSCCRWHSKSGEQWQWSRLSRAVSLARWAWRWVALQYLAWGLALPVGVWATAVRWFAPFFGASFVLVLGRLCNITKHKPISKRVSCRRRLIIPCARGVRGEGVMGWRGVREVRLL